MEGLKSGIAGGGGEGSEDGDAKAGKGFVFILKNLRTSLWATEGEEKNREWEKGGKKKVRRWMWWI